MGKIPKFGYWELRLGALLVFAVDATILIPTFFFFLKINNPEPRSFDQYAYYSDPNGFYHPIWLSRYIQGSEESLKYFANFTGQNKVSIEKEKPILLPGTKIGIIKYSPDSLHVKVKASGFAKNKYLNKGVGWIPTILIHNEFDSTKIVKYHFHYPSIIIQ